MESVEVSAKTVEEAREAAAVQLGLQPEAIEIEVISAPRKILGVIGTGQYTVRAWPQGQASPPAAVPAEGETEAEVAVEEQASNQPEAGEATRQQVAQQAQDILARILELMGASAEISPLPTEDEGLCLDIRSEGSPALIIGRHGDTLDALQFLVSVGANRGIKDGYRVSLDAGGYRQRQADQLRKMAYSHADQAVANGQEAVLAGLSSYERRIVHLALVDRPDVETYSEGEGPERNLVISPSLGAAEEAPPDDSE